MLRSNQLAGFGRRRGGSFSGDGNPLLGTFTGYTLGGITVSADTEYNGNFPAWEAFDQTTQFWNSTNTAAPHWLKVDFGSSQIVYKYSITGRGSTNDIRDFELQGSDNNNTWTTLDTQIDKGISGLAVEYVLASSATYRYFRLYMTDNNGGGGYSVVALQLYD
tara:strand:+ start:542 stop:1030 length:489 start_codon:yes stop_codon:yes gene_type:complete